MNKLSGITLLFESLEPIENPETISISVGTITLLLTQKLPLNFKETRTSHDMKPSFGTRFYVILQDLNPDLQAYQSVGLSPEDLTYDFFRSRISSTYVSKIYTELVRNGKKVPIPLTLKKMHLYFSNGRLLDYTNRISVFLLNELAEVA